MELEKLEYVSPSPNLSIDILSLNNTNCESDGSFDGFEAIDLKKTVSQEGKSYEELESNRFIRCSSQIHSNYRFSSAKIQDDFWLNFNNDVFIGPEDIYSKNSAVSSEKENIVNHFPHNHYYNSLYVYLKSLSNEKDLNKYFRPCHTCKKTFCICLDSLASYNVPVLSFDSCRKQQQNEEIKQNFLGRKTVSTTNLMKKNKAVETDFNITGFDGCRYNLLSFRSSKSYNDKGSSECSDLESSKESSCRNSRTNFSVSHNERKCNCCCRTLTCEHSTNDHLNSGIVTKPSFELPRKACFQDDPNQLLTWIPFLESVARDAQNLVSNLELIMKTYKYKNDLK